MADDVGTGPADAGAASAMAPEVSRVIDDLGRGAPPPALHAGPLPDDWDDVAHVRSFFDQSPVAMWLIVIGDQQVYANPATAELFHLQRPAHLADAGSMLHESERERTFAEIVSLMRGDVDRISRVKRYRRPDGTEFWGHLDATRLTAPDGKPWAVLSVCRDVTVQREAERALVEREAWFEALVRNNVDAIIVVDAQARLTYASPGAEELVGGTVAEQLGRDVLTFVHPDDREVVGESFLNTAATPGVAVPLRFRVLRPSGEARLVEAVATNLLDEPAVRGVVVNLRDLTEREQVTTALEVSENRFRKMLENISDTVTLIDEAGQVIRTTGNVKEILGYPTEFWSIRNAFDIAHPDDLDLIRTMFVQLLEQPGGTVAGEFRVRAATGEFEFIEANATNLLDDPEVGAIVVTTRNISARKQAERELGEARDQALRALEVRNEFVASVSHELRTPIHGIVGLAELLATSGDLPDDAVQLALSIRRATESLRLVLDDILDFSKIEAGRLELTPQAVPVQELLDDLDALFGPQLAAKGVGLRLGVDDRLPALVEADGLRLRQVLNNLVSNAVKFTAAGTVSVRLGAMGPADRPDQLLIEVADTGIGMSSEVQRLIFEPFSQAHATTAREYGGTGLGLTIARRLVDLMGGQLSVASELGRGSTFTVLLPLRLPPNAMAVGATDPVGAAGPSTPRRVLVVEDNPVNQLLVSRQLERLGHEAVIAASGEEALEAYAGEPFDAVLMDWQMPGLSGLETTARLRRWEVDHDRPRVPIVAMTASAMPGDRERCIAAGMDDFVAKPVDLATLGRTLAGWLYGPVDAPTPNRPGDASSAEPVDASVLDRLADELEDRELVVSVIGTYLRELDGRVEKIEDAARSGNAGELRAVAHTLKSTSAALGAVGMSGLCRTLEESAATEGGVGGLEALLGRVVVERDRVRAGLMAEATRLGSVAPVVD